MDTVIVNSRLVNPFCLGDSDSDKEPLVFVTGGDRYASDLAPLIKRFENSSNTATDSLNGDAPPSSGRQPAEPAEVPLRNRGRSPDAPVDDTRSPPARPAILHSGVRHRNGDRSLCLVKNAWKAPPLAVLVTPRGRLLLQRSSKLGGTHLTCGGHHAVSQKLWVYMLLHGKALNVHDDTWDLDSLTRKVISNKSASFIKEDTSKHGSCHSG
jgi:hypothetical protein